MLDSKKLPTVRSPFDLVFGEILAPESQGLPMPLNKLLEDPPMAVAEASVVSARGAVGSGCTSIVAFVNNFFASSKQTCRLPSNHNFENEVPGCSFFVAMSYNGCKV